MSFFVTKLFQMTRLLFLSLDGGTSGVDRDLIAPLLCRCAFRASICLWYQVTAGESARRRGPVGVPGKEIEGNVGGVVRGTPNFLHS